MPTGVMDIPEQERAFREEVLLYLVARHEAAADSLQERQLEAFQSFASLWLEALDWRTEDGIRRYLELGETQRLERMTRFRRQAESWDVTLEFPVEPTRRQDEERAKWRRDYERTKKKLRADRDQQRWDAVKEMLENESRLRTMPSWLRDSFQFLGLPPRATLAEARRRYRELAKTHHPDTTGSTQQMARLNDAWQKVEAFFLA